MAKLRLVAEATAAGVDSGVTEAIARGPRAVASSGPLLGAGRGLIDPAITAELHGPKRRSLQRPDWCGSEFYSFVIGELLEDAKRRLRGRSLFGDSDRAQRAERRDLVAKAIIGLRLGRRTKRSSARRAARALQAL
jgi:hypothetical protein